MRRTGHRQRIPFLCSNSPKGAAASCRNSPAIGCNMRLRLRFPIGMLRPWDAQPPLQIRLMLKAKLGLASPGADATAAVRGCQARRATYTAISVTGDDPLG